MNSYKNLVEIHFLIIRLIKGKKIWEAHREHYYQKAVQSGMSHSQVVKFIIALQTLIIMTCYFIENPYLVVFSTNKSG